jgi:putative inorganic carbon (hco3(-)) transporter
LGLGFLIAFSSCILANCFGDRWTYLEINGLLWVLMGAVVRANELTESTPRIEGETADSLSIPSHLAWR